MLLDVITHRFDELARLDDGTSVPAREMWMLMHPSWREVRRIEVTLVSYPGLTPCCTASPLHDSVRRAQPLPDLYTLNHAQKDTLIVALYAIAGEVEALRQHVTELEAQLARNSSNSRIPLDNNLAERAIRPYVRWRKQTYAVQSHRGNQFRPMILAVVGTVERLGMNVLDYLRRICTEQLKAGRVRTLLPLEGAYLAGS